MEAPIDMEDIEEVMLDGVMGTVKSTLQPSILAGLKNPTGNQGLPSAQLFSDANQVVETSKTRME